MFSTFIRKVSTLDLEEKILNLMLIVSMVGVALPWIGGKLSLIDDKTVTYSGFSFYTSIIGFAIFGLLSFSLLTTLIPLLSGNQLVKREKKSSIRLGCTFLSSILILSSLSVLIQVTFNSPGMEVRFGIYTALIGSMIATLYSFLSLQEGKKRDVQELFHQKVDALPDLSPQEPAQYQQPAPIAKHEAPSAPEPEIHGQIRR